MRIQIGTLYCEYGKGFEYLSSFLEWNIGLSDFGLLIMGLRQGSRNEGLYLGHKSEKLTQVT